MELVKSKMKQKKGGLVANHNRKKGGGNGGTAPLFLNLVIGGEI